MKNVWPSALVVLAMGVTMLGFLLLLGHLALGAYEYEQARYESDANLYNEFMTQPPLGS
jgi:hypothetical protein